MKIITAAREFVNNVADGFSAIGDVLRDIWPIFILVVFGFFAFIFAHTSTHVQTATTFEMIGDARVRAKVQSFADTYCAGGIFTVIVSQKTCDGLSMKLEAVRSIIAGDAIQATEEERTR